MSDENAVRIRAENMALSVAWISKFTGYIDPSKLVGSFKLTRIFHWSETGPAKNYLIRYH